MPGKLEEIETEEISLVDVPANKRKFLFTKADTDGSDSTVPNGILTCPNCGHQEALIDFVKNASELCPECGANLLSSDTEIIFKRRHIMDDTLLELFETLFEDDEDLTDEEVAQIEKAEKKLPKEALNALKGALTMLNKYKAKFPDNVKEAINTLAKFATSGYGYPAKKKDEDDDVEKAGAKLSKDTVSKLKKIIGLIEKAPEAIKLLKEMVPTEAKKSEEILVDKLDQVIDAIGKLAETGEVEEEEDTDDDEGKKKKKTKKTGLEKQVEELSGVVKKIAEAKGLSKLLKGQGGKEEIEEDEEDEELDQTKTKTKKSKKKIFPWSFSFTTKERMEKEQEEDDE